MSTPVGNASGQGTTGGDAASSASARASRPVSGGTLAWAIVLVIALAVGVAWYLSSSFNRLNAVADVKAQTQRLLEGVLAGDDASIQALVPAASSDGLAARSDWRFDLSLLSGAGAETSLGENIHVQLVGADLAGKKASYATVLARVSGSLRSVDVSVRFSNVNSNDYSDKSWRPEAIVFPSVRIGSVGYGPAVDVASTQLNGVEVKVDQGDTIFAMWPGPARFTANDSKGNSIQDSDLGTLGGGSLTSELSSPDSRTTALNPQLSQQRVLGLVEGWLRQEVDAYVADPRQSTLANSVAPSIPNPKTNFYDSSDATAATAPAVRNLKVLTFRFPKQVSTYLMDTNEGAAPKYLLSGVDVTFSGQWKDGSTWRDFQMNADRLTVLSGTVDLQNSVVTNEEVEKSNEGGR